MAELAREVLQSNDLGSIFELDNPRGITWLQFSALALTDYIDGKDIVGNGLDIVPVPTDELEAVVGRTLDEDDMFWADVNIAATSMADVSPANFAYEPPLTDEQIEEFKERISNAAQQQDEPSAVEQQ